MPDPLTRKRANRRGGRRVTVGALIETLRERARARAQAPLFFRPRSARITGSKLSKRKAALALSAGAISLSAGAVDRPPPVKTVQMQVDPTMRRSADLLRTSEALKQAMIEEEGARSTVYRDVAGYPTVGIGHLVTPADGLQVGDRVSKDRIIDFLEDDLREAEAAVVRLAGDMPLNQHEFDALVDLAFNVEGTLSPDESPRLNAAIAARDYDAIASELKYRFARGKKAMGLVFRSERRTQIFLDGSYDDPRDMA